MVSLSIRSMCISWLAMRRACSVVEMPLWGGGVVGWWVVVVGGW
jgi:hypothetical protein